MIDMIPVLPRGVIPREGMLEDKATQQQYPMNATALQLLSLIDGKRPLSSIITELAEYYQQSEEAIAPDILLLSQKLQRNRLLNLQEKWRQFFFRWLISLQTRVIPYLYGWRSDPPATMNIAALFFWTCLIVFRAWFPFFGFGLISVIAVGNILGIFLPLTAYFAFTWICIVLSIALHEAGHLIVLRRLQGRDCGFFVHIGPSIHLVRPRQTNLRSEIMISLIGPLAPTLIAVCMLIWHLLHGSVIDWIVIAIFGVHALQLILPNRDLINIFRLVQIIRK